MNNNPAYPALITGLAHGRAELGQERLKPRSRVRGFSLLDGMIFVAATAVALSLMPSGSDPIMHRKLVKHPELFFQIATPFVAAWTVVIFASGLIRRRRSVRELARCPGWSACAAASLILLCMGLFNLGVIWPPPQAKTVMWIRIWHRIMSANALPVMYSWSLMIAPAVAAGWLILALGGRRSSDRGWLNPAGRLLGLCWIVFGVSLTWREIRDSRDDLKTRVAREEARAAGIRINAPVYVVGPPSPSPQPR